MFAWIGKRLAKAMWPIMVDQIYEWLNEEDTVALLDGMIDRQYQRFMGKIGGTMKGVNSDLQQAGIPVTANLDAKQLILQMLARNFMGQGSQRSGGLP